MAYKQSIIFAAGLFLTLLCLMSCGGDSTPTPTIAQLYTAAPVTTPSPSPFPTTVRTATRTLTRPSATPLPQRPTATRRPTLVPTNATATALAMTATRAAATANALPESGPIGGPDFPPDINPLTGLPVSDTTVLERCPLAIKISNAPEVVRPQAGLDLADLVFEHYAEGGVTRLTAVFLGETPKTVGSIRSGRLIDEEIPAMYKALFAYSGTSAGVGQRYAQSDLWPDQLAPPGRAGAAYYRRNLPKAYEHTLFVNPIELWAEAEKRGISGRQDLRGLTFETTPPDDGSPAQDIDIAYRAGISRVRWTFDASAGRYYRWQGGVAHREELSGDQLSSANVIIVSANHIETDILEDTWGGGHWSIEIQIWGEGPASIFRDGQRYDGLWRRRDRHDMLSFWTTDGKQRLPLKPGNSWLQMVPLGFTGLEVEP